MADPPSLASQMPPSYHQAKAEPKLPPARHRLAGLAASGTSPRLGASPRTPPGGVTPAGGATPAGGTPREGAATPPEPATPKGFPPVSAPVPGAEPPPGFPSLPGGVPQPSAPPAKGGTARELAEALRRGGPGELQAGPLGKAPGPPPPGSRLPAAPMPGPPPGARGPGVPGLAQMPPANPAPGSTMTPGTTPPGGATPRSTATTPRTARSGTLPTAARLAANMPEHAPSEQGDFSGVPAPPRPTLRPGLARSKTPPNVEEAEQRKESAAEEAAAARPAAASAPPPTRKAPGEAAAGWGEAPAAPPKRGANLVGRPVAVRAEEEPRKPMIFVPGKAHGKTMQTDLRGHASSDHLDMSIVLTGVMCLIARCTMAFWLFFLSGVEDLKFAGWLSYLLGLLAALFGVCGMMRHGAMPLGCECIPACADAEVGCFTCPWVPWILSVWSVLAVFLGAAFIGAGFFNVDGLLFFIDVIGSLALAAFSVWWLWLIREQEGRAFCVRRAVPEEEGSLVDEGALPLPPPGGAPAQDAAYGGLPAGNAAYGGPPAQGAANGAAFASAPVPAPLPGQDAANGGAFASAPVPPPLPGQDALPQSVPA